MEVRFALSYEALKMKGKLSERVTPLMISAMRTACSSLSITHGPAMRNRSPEPTVMSPILNDLAISCYASHPSPCLGESLDLRKITAVPLFPAGETFLLRRLHVALCASVYARTMLPQKSGTKDAVPGASI